MTWVFPWISWHGCPPVCEGAAAVSTGCPPSQSICASAGWLRWLPPSSLLSWSRSSSVSPGTPKVLARPCLTAPSARQGAPSQQPEQGIIDNLNYVRPSVSGWFPHNNTIYGARGRWCFGRDEVYPGLSWKPTTFEHTNTPNFLLPRPHEYTVWPSTDFLPVVTVESKHQYM